jgi:hypothetical protein
MLHTTRISLKAVYQVSHLRVEVTGQLLDNYRAVLSTISLY